MKSKGEKDLDGLMNVVKSVKLRKTVISKRLEAGRTIQLDFKTKAQLLTIISKDETNGVQNASLIIGEGRTLRIALIADPFAPEVLLSVCTVEKS